MFRNLGVFATHHTGNGNTAGFIDQKESLVGHAPLVVAIVAITTLVLLFLLTGSVLLPLKTLLMNTLTLGAITDPGVDTVTGWAVAWGDGASDAYSAGGNVTHTYACAPCSPVILVDLSDEDGTHPSAGSLSITVAVPPPIVVDAGDMLSRLVDHRRR
mgnify:CR=1 FL=1